MWNTPNVSLLLLFSYYLNRFVFSVCVYVVVYLFFWSYTECVNPNNQKQLKSKEEHFKLFSGLPVTCFLLHSRKQASLPPLYSIPSASQVSHFQLHFTSRGGDVQRQSNNYAAFLKLSYIIRSLPCFSTWTSTLVSANAAVRRIWSVLILFLLIFFLRSVTSSEVKSTQSHLWPLISRGTGTGCWGGRSRRGGAGWRWFMQHSATLR